MSFELQQLVPSDKLSQLTMLGDNYFSFGMSQAKKWRDIADSEMNQIVRRIKDGVPWDEVIYQFTASNKWVRSIAISPSRSLFLDLLDFTGVQSAIDIGAGWGALTLALAERVSKVVAVDATNERLHVIEAICKQQGRTNVGFLHGDIFNLPFKESSFDLVLLCGVYEWLANNGSEEDVRVLQERALSIVSRLLTPAGKLVIAIENRLGLKYLLGERDDHSKERHFCYLPFEEAAQRYREQKNAPLRSRTYDCFEYEASLRAAGFSAVKFYLAFPDYKLPQLLVPADDLSGLKKFIEHSLMPNEHDGCNGHPSEYSETLRRIYRGLNNVDIVSYLAPSYIIVAEKKP